MNLEAEDNKSFERENRFMQIKKPNTNLQSVSRLVNLLRRGTNRGGEGKANELFERSEQLIYRHQSK